MNSRILALLLLALSGGFVSADAQDAPPIDYTKLIQAPARLYLGEGLALGMRYERRTKTPSQEVSEFMAVVGEAEDRWEIETNQGLATLAEAPGGAGLTLALVVEKKSYKVLLARIGKVGQPLQTIKVLSLETAPAPSAEAPARSEEFALPSGKKVQAEVHLTKAGEEVVATAWVGAKGTPLAGVWLGMRGGTTIRLREDPSSVTVEVASDDPQRPRPIAAVKTAFDNGLSTWDCQDEILRAFNQRTLRSETEHFTTWITGVQTQAKKTLTWK